MSGAGFDVDLSALSVLAQDMSDLGAGVKELAQTAQDATLPDDAWGLVGQFLLPVYGTVQAKAMEGLGRGGEFWTALSNNVQASSEAYDAVDERISLTLNSYHQQGEA